eukprot:3543945-Ditylum_brightwellii.AAC.1
MALWTRTMHLHSPLGRWCQPGLSLQQEPTNWVPTSMCIPIAATMTDGAHTWQSEGYSGIVGEVIVHQDGTFQNYLH